jgi:phage terminase large subunit
MQSGTKRAVLVWHRRAGKDKTALNYTISQMFPENGGRIGTYYHFLPTYNQGKKIIWDGIDYNGMKFMDHFPPELVASKNETEMQVTLSNGSIYQVIGTDKMDNIVGTNPLGCVFSEYSLQNPKAWDLFRPILRENKGWALFIYTPRGRNHGKQLYEMAKNNPEWFCELRTVLDTEREDGSPIITSADIENDRKEGMDEQLIQQEYYCSFEGYQQGSYYSKQLREAELTNRIANVPWDCRLQVHTFWDLGIGDAMSIWFMQRVGKEYRFIDYYEASGEGISYYAKYLSQKPYKYGVHYMPHDASVRELGTGISRKDRAEQLGIRPVEVVPNNISVEEGIDAVRAVLPVCWFDKEKCEHGLNALANYRKEWDEDRREFKARPYHDWSSHGADAFRIFAVGWDEPIEYKPRKPLDYSNVYILGDMR